jgi:hypothetical protein
MFLATSGSTLRTVPTTLRGVFETNTPHMKLRNELNVTGGARVNGMDIPIGRGNLRRHSQPSENDHGKPEILT